MVKRERGSFREVLFLSLSLSLSLFLSENLKRGGEIFFGWSQARERHTSKKRKYWRRLPFSSEKLAETFVVESLK